MRRSLASAALVLSLSAPAAALGAPRALASAALLLALSAPAAARLGVDVSTPVSAADAACMRANHSIDFAVSRAWFSDGAGVDRGALTSAAAFKAAGVAFDVYMFPCSFGLPAAAQVAQLLANLSAARVEFGTLWMDIEFLFIFSSIIF